MHTLKLLAILFLFLPRGYSQETKVDFRSGDIEVFPDPGSRTLTGKVRYTLTTDGRADSLVLDARHMEIGDILLDGQAVPHRYDGERIAVAAPSDPGQHTLEIGYSARPRQAVYFTGWEDAVQGNEEIWTQGQGKYSSHWVPSFDDMREKVVFDLKVSAGPAFKVVANGRLAGVEARDTVRSWSFDMKKPMSSYLLAFAVGAYDSLRLTASSGVPIYLYYPQGEKAKALIAYRHTREIFDFLESEIGVPYPWQDYKQVPVRDFLYAGMENTGATFFAHSFLVDSVGLADRDYLNVNAHELAHQWFGDLVTETDGGQHWLHEGFATFYAYLSEAHIHGPEHLHWILYRTANALKQLREGVRGAALTDPGAGSLIFYEKGAWALFWLRELLGENDFRQGIRTFLQTYAFGNATVSDFLQVMEHGASRSLAEFRAQWLESETFPYEEALSFLRSHSPSVAHYLTLAGSETDQAGLRLAWQAFDLAPYRAALLARFGDSFGEDLLREAFTDTRPEVQKALMETLGDMREWMKPYLFRMLEAGSYQLREAALYRLWTAYPENRADYLDLTASNGSMEAGAFRQTWWLLALFTEHYADPARAAGYLRALRATTGPSFDREVRENGFRLLQQVDALGEENLVDLLGATEHPSWQFRLFARRMLDDLMDSRPDRALWERLARDFPRERFPYVNDKLDNL